VILTPGVLTSEEFPHDTPFTGPENFQTLGDGWTDDRSVPLYPHIHIALGESSIGRDRQPIQAEMG